jgi:hypothetical protein
VAAVVTPRRGSNMATVRRQHGVGAALRVSRRVSSRAVARAAWRRVGLPAPVFPA